MDARRDATKTKSLVATFKENPEIFGVGVGSLLTFSSLPGTAANPFLNLRVRLPFKSVNDKVHLEYLTKKVKVTSGTECFEIASGQANGFQNFGKAREMARVRANLVEDSIPYLATLGPYKENVYVGMQSPDGTSLWRLDLNKKTKQPHINWAYKDATTGEKYYGAINIDISVEQYWEIVNKFPRKLKLIG